VMVRSRRLELPRVAPQRPQRCASTNSATTARHEGPVGTGERPFSKSLSMKQGFTSLFRAIFREARQAFDSIQFIHELDLFGGRLHIHAVGGAVPLLEPFRPPNIPSCARQASGPIHAT
jgi:hypothetical protein